MLCHLSGKAGLGLELGLGLAVAVVPNDNNKHFHSHNAPDAIDEFITIPLAVYFQLKANFQSLFKTKICETSWTAKVPIASICIYRRAEIVRGLSCIYIVYVCVCLFVALPVIMQPTHHILPVCLSPPSHSPATSARHRYCAIHAINSGCVAH